MAWLTREEIKAKYGFDPAGDSVDTAPVDEGGGFKDHLKSLAVGTAAAIPEVINFPSTVYAGGKALYDTYGTDKAFLPEFQKNIQIEGADELTQKHINEVAQSWMQRDPSLTPEAVQKGIADYQKTKQFEDFKTEHLSGTHYLTAKTKQLARGLLGDERPESKRSWTESAAEVLGGSLIGGPAGWAAKAATVPGLAAVAANPVGKATIRTAEALTPLTIPYNPTNIAINTAAGVAMDQGTRYLGGQSTAFTPTPEDPASVGTLAASGAGVVGAVAFANAIRGRTHAALRAQQANPTPTAAELANNPSLDTRVKPEPREGEAFMVSGAEQTLGPSSELASLPWYQSARYRLRDAIFDQGGGVTSAQIRKTHNREEAFRLEELRTSNSGSVLNDAIEGHASTVLQPLVNSFKALSPENARAYLTGWWHSSYASDVETVIAHNQQNAAKLQAVIHAQNTSPQQMAAAQKQLTKTIDDIKRLSDEAQGIAPDPSSRFRIPETPLYDVFKMRDTFLNDMSPEAVKVKDAIKTFNRQMLDLAVYAEKMTKKAADDLHARNPYFVQAMSDPLGHLPPGKRLFESVSQEINMRMTRASEGTGGAAAHEGPLRHLDKDIHEIRQPGDPETRITAPLNPISAAANYTRQMFRDVAHTRVRNEHVRALAYKDKIRIPSDYLRDGRMRAVQGARGTWFGPGQLHRPEVHAIARRSDVVQEWQGGRVRFWEFGDSEIPRALRFEPVLMTGLMKGVQTSANIMKFFTTGRGNPAFALKGALYDTGIAMLTRPHDRAFGTASYLMHKYMPRTANVVGRYLPDPTAYTALPWHGFASFVELQAYHMSGALARYLPSQVPGFAALRAAVGPVMFRKMLNASLKVAAWAEQRPAVALHRAGATRGAQTIDAIPKIRSAFNMVESSIPAPARAAWQFYTDILDSFYLANKRQYYSQNYALELRRKGHVSDMMNERLINETRRMAGDMSMVPGSKTMRDLETFFPYLTQTKLGAYHLGRNMFSRDTAMATNAKLLVAMSGVAMSMHMMTHWDEKSKDYFWNRVPEHERNRHVWIPHPKLLAAWAQGKNLPFSHDLYWKVPVPPDISGIIAGTVAFMQMTGGIPADATPKPFGIKEVANVFIDSITPAMPPSLQVALGAFSKKLDPQSSETRGGNWIRDMQSNFRSGPQAEAYSNLGQISNSTALMLNGLFGAMGAHLAQGTDIMMHAAKFHQPTPGAPFQPRKSADFAAGLRAATTRVFNDVTSKVPDVPALWKGEDKAVASTPAWRYVAENMVHIRSIADMRDFAEGKTSQLQQQQALRIGGIPATPVSDPVLISAAKEVRAWYQPSGPLGKLRAEYTQLSKQAGSVRVAYNMPQEQRKAMLNRVVTAQQDNMMKQQRAVNIAEKYLSDKYGQVLAPRLNGRQLDMVTLNSIMRESVGTPNMAASAGNEQGR